MGIFSKSSNRLQGASGSLSLIAQGTSIKGELSSSNEIQIDGEFNGNIKCTDTLHISNTGKVTGDIEAENLVIFGEFSGKITATRVEIGSSANVQADIVTTTISISEGAKFEGTQKQKANLKKDVSHVQTKTTPKMEKIEPQRNNDISSENAV